MQNYSSAVQIISLNPILCPVKALLLISSNVNYRNNFDQLEAKCLNVIRDRGFFRALSDLSNKLWTPCCKRLFVSFSKILSPILNILFRSLQSIKVGV